MPSLGWIGAPLTPVYPPITNAGMGRPVGGRRTNADKKSLLLPRLRYGGTVVIDNQITSKPVFFGIASGPTNIKRNTCLRTGRLKPRRDLVQTTVKSP